jgi:hypothetical protein
VINGVCAPQSLARSEIEFPLYKYYDRNIGLLSSEWVVQSEKLFKRYNSSYRRQQTAEVLQKHQCYEMEQLWGQGMRSEGEIGH